MTIDDVMDKAWNFASVACDPPSAACEQASNDLRTAILALVAQEREECAKIVIGWRESDWPEGFDRKTAEIVVRDRVTAIRARGNE